MNLNKYFKVLATIIVLVLSYSHENDLNFIYHNLMGGVSNLNSNPNIERTSMSRNDDIITHFHLVEPVKYNLKENINRDVEVRFCGKDNCFDLLNKSLSNAKKEIKCAFYDLGDMDISNTLLKKSNQNINISLIIDDKYLKEEALKKLYNSNIKIYSDLNRGTKYNNYMHNKYCIIDDQTIITGSTNPTKNGFYKNNNNMIRFDSKYLAKNYENDFDQMALYNKYGFQKISVLNYNNISLIFNNMSNNYSQKYLISSYFCPPDGCVDKIIEILNKSKKEIYFATFSFTQNDIEVELENLNKKGINISGVIETKNRNGRSSIFKDTKDLKIYLDKNKYNLHDKYFIIDDDYVITGSMNPSNNGNRYNDENIIIIKNNRIANLYKKNYFSLIKD